MSKICVAAANYPITFHESWENWERHTEKWIMDAVQKGAEILVFPEYGSLELVSLMPEEFRNNLSKQVRKLEEFKSDFCACFQKWSIQNNSVIVAPSMPVSVGGKWVNRAFVFSPEGRMDYQDKFFMTRFEAEEWGIDSGEKILKVFEYKGIRFGIQICYDIEFAIGARYLAQAGAQFILVPSCTETLRGATRVHIGARARALEQQLYTVVAQTTGEAHWSPAVDVNFGYTGFYISPDLNFPEEGVISRSSFQEQGWLIQTLNISKIEELRINGSVLNFKSHQGIEIGFEKEELKVVVAKLG